MHPVLRHRMGLNFAAVSEGQTTDDIVDMLVKHVPERGIGFQPVTKAS